MVNNSLKSHLEFPFIHFKYPNIKSILLSNN